MTTRSGRDRHRNILTSHMHTHTYVHKPSRSPKYYHTSGVRAAGMGIGWGSAGFRHQRGGVRRESREFGAGLRKTRRLSSSLISVPILRSLKSLLTCLQRPPFTKKKKKVSFHNALYIVADACLTLPRIATWSSADTPQSNAKIRRTLGAGEGGREIYLGSLKRDIGISTS